MIPEPEGAEDALCHWCKDVGWDAFKEEEG